MPPGTGLKPLNPAAFVIDQDQYTPTKGVADGIRKGTNLFDRTVIAGKEDDPCRVEFFEDLGLTLCSVGLPEPLERGGSTSILSRLLTDDTGLTLCCECLAGSSAPSSSK